MINIVEHKNTVLYLIDVIYDGNLLGNSVSLVKKEELKATVQNDFLQLIFYPALDLINSTKSLVVFDNKSENMFFQTFYNSRRFSNSHDPNKSRNRKN